VSNSKEEEVRVLLRLGIGFAHTKSGLDLVTQSNTTRPPPPPRVLLLLLLLS
jgi:hypothetical protein